MNKYIIFLKHQFLAIKKFSLFTLSRKFAKLLLYLSIIPIVIIIHLFSPLILIRIGPLHSRRIGHFALNMELYLCEKKYEINTPKGRYFDLFYLDKLVSNKQLAKMWRRKFNILPRFLLLPIHQINQLLPNSDYYKAASQYADRDVNNLLDKCPPFLDFTEKEESKGQLDLRALGIPKGSQFVCLLVRDSGYLSSYISGRDWGYHNYRDSDVNNYILAAETLANEGIYVIRMGKNVHANLASSHPKIIDYATNGMRSDFMDIYLSANCLFFISQSSGLDAIPAIFRRPIVYVNMVPLTYFFTFKKDILGLFKHHIDRETNIELSFGEIFECGAGQCLRSSCFDTKRIQLVENTPKEICDIVMEKYYRIIGKWIDKAGDIDRQKKFWSIFPDYAFDENNKDNNPLHGKIFARVGADYLRENVTLLNEESLILKEHE